MDTETKTSGFYPNTVPLGVEGMPWPTMIESREGGVVKTELGRIEDDRACIMLPSQLEQMRVWGELYRSMPVPSQLPTFEQVASLTMPTMQNPHRMIYMIGNPGVGKSFLGDLMGRVRHTDGPIIVNMAGKSAESLLWETVFDTNQSKSLTHAIDLALKNGTLDPVSLDRLKHTLGEYMVDRAIDWEAVVKGTEKIGPKALEDLLIFVRTNERWDTNSMGIGFKVREGALVMAAKTGRDLVIDEFSDMKEGTEKILNPVLQVLNGEIPEYTVQLGSNGTYTFKGNVNNIVVFTGNKPRDSISTRPMAQSVSSRLPPHPIPDFTIEDWQHRFCQVWCGLPVSTLHRMQPGKMVKIDGNDVWQLNDEKAFTKTLQFLHDLGKTDAEKASPRHQLEHSNIQNWPKILDASRNLGAFYYEYSQLADADSSLYKGRDPSMAKIRKEVREALDPLPPVTPRLMLEHIVDARTNKPRKRTINGTSGFDTKRDWSQPVKLKSKVDEPIEITQGGQLAHAIHAHIAQISQDKPELGAKLAQTAADCNLDKCGQLLSFTPKDRTVVSEPLADLQHTLVESLRQRFPDVTISPEDEQVLPLKALSRHVEGMAKLPEPAPKKSHIIVPQQDPEQFINAPLTVIDTRSLTPETMDKFEKFTTQTYHCSKLMPVASLLKNFTLPVIGARNLKAMFTPSFDEQAFGATARVANGGEKLVVTSLACANPDQTEFRKLHVIKNTVDNLTLIVGEESIEPELRRSLLREGINYIDTGEPDAKASIKRVLHELAPTSQDRGVMLDAFKLRNQVGNPSLALEEVLADPSASRLGTAHFVPNQPIKDTGIVDRLLGGR